jgi:thiol-disulfide isomerase/thioredoxin
VGVALLIGMLLKKVPEEGRWVKRGGWSAAGLVAAVGLWNGVWVAQNWNVVEPVGRGDVAPGFVLKELGRDGQETGATVQLDSLRGQVVLLDFWASWCDPCVRGIPFLGELQRRYGKDGFSVVSIKLDGRRLGRARRPLLQTDFLLALATEEVANRYQVTTLPHLVLIDRTGVVRHLWRGAGEKLASQIEELLAR